VCDAGDRIGVFLAPEERAEEMINAISVFPFTDDMKALLVDVNKMERLVADPTKSLSKDLNEKYFFVPPSLSLPARKRCPCVHACDIQLTLASTPRRYQDQEANAELPGAAGHRH
jgi:hypothetical protein